MRKRWEHLRSSWKPSWPTSPTPVRQRSAMLPLLKQSIGRACWTSATTSWTASVAPVDTQHYLYRDIHFYGKLWNNDYFGQDSFVVVCVCVLCFCCVEVVIGVFFAGGGVGLGLGIFAVCVTVLSCVLLLFFQGGVVSCCLCGCVCYGSLILFALFFWQKYKWNILQSSYTYRVQALNTGNPTNCTDHEGKNKSLWPASKGLICSPWHMPWHLCLKKKKLIRPQHPTTGIYITAEWHSIQQWYTVVNTAIRRHQITRLNSNPSGHH